MKVDNFYFSWLHSIDSTSCLVFKDPPEGSLKNVTPTVIGTAFLNPHDHYDNSVGRKVSLLKAFRELTKKQMIDDDFRPRAWEVYRTMTKEPRWLTQEEREAKKPKPPHGQA